MEGFELASKGDVQSSEAGGTTEVHVAQVLLLYMYIPRVHLLV